MSEYTTQPTETPDAFWSIECHVTDADTAEAYATLMEEYALSVSFFEMDDGTTWHLAFVWPAATNAPEEGNKYLDRVRTRLQDRGLFIPDLTATYLAPRNWLLENQRTFKPFSIGPFFIYPSHYEGTIPAGQYPLKIDAATAFGSGEHPTTQGCLLAMSRLYEMGGAPARILDLGCGSGILALAAARLWPKAAIWALDNDPEAVQKTEYNAIENNLMQHIRSAVSEGVNGPLRQGNFDLILANILAEPLKHLASDLSGALAPQGVLILSGLLTRQEEDVLSAYRPFGFYSLSLPQGEWDTLVLTRSEVGQ